jgi:SAM-dependent methyltransferase
MEVVLSTKFIEQLKNDASSIKGVTENNDLEPVYEDKQHYYGMLKELSDNIEDIKNKKVLEIGSGYGLLCAIANRELGYDFHGIEPTKFEAGGRFEVSTLLFEENEIDLSKITSGIGEQLPYADESFDVVFSFQVLEHVKDPYLVLKESWRVLKKGGILYINAPNYNFFFEGHYHIFWIPNMPKWMAKAYVKLIGRNTDYLNYLNFLNEKKLNKWLIKITGYKKINSDFGYNDWKDRMLNANFNEHLPKSAKGLYQIAKTFGLIRLIISLGKYFRWQDCLRVSLKK